MKIFIVIPTYNESENLKKLVEKIFQFEDIDINAVIVDDNSADGTGKIADGLAEKYPLSVIHRPGKLGIGSAYIEGFKYALESGADAVFEMDADFSHDPKEIPNFIREIKNGFDVVVGSRRIRGGKIIGWNWRRKFYSRGAMSFARLVLGLRTRDVTAGYRCYRREVLEKIDLDRIKSNGYAFQEEMIWLCERKGFKIKEIPIVFVDRRYGKSKLGFWEIISFFIIMFRLRFRSLKNQEIKK